MKHRAIPLTPFLLAAFMAAFVLASLWALPAFAEETQDGTANALANPVTSSVAEDDAATDPEPDPNETLNNANALLGPSDETNAAEDGANNKEPLPSPNEAATSPDNSDDISAAEPSEADDTASDGASVTEPAGDEGSKDGAGAEGEEPRKAGLVTDGRGTRYLQADGTYFAGGWKTVGGETYYFGGDGYALRYSQWIDGRLYYFKKDGSRHEGWVNWYAGGRSYFSPRHNGAAAKGWWTIGGERYHFDAGDRYRRAERYTQEIGGKTYYFNAKGQMFNDG